MKKNYIFSITLLSIFALQVNAQSYLFEKTIDSPDRNPGDSFGTSFDLNSDFFTVSSPGHAYDENGDNYMFYAGSIQIFNLDQQGNVFAPQKLVSPSRSSFESFGMNHALTSNQIIVGAIGYDELELDTTNNQGATYVFTLEDNSWVMHQKLTASDRSEDDQFGNQIITEGDYLIITAPIEDHDEVGMNELSNSGSAYVFKKDGSGNWVEIQKIVASDRSQDDIFGASAHMSGARLIIGSPDNDKNLINEIDMMNAGAAYIYERTTDSTFEQTAKLIPSDRQPGEYFGSNVLLAGGTAFISSNNKTAIVGSDTLIDAGAVYVFNNDFTNGWIQTQKITSPNAEDYGYFGRSISVQDDVLVIGAPTESTDEDGNNPVNSSGAIYIFRLSIDGVWELDEKLVNNNREMNDQFGASVLLHEQTLMVGIPKEDEDANNQNTVSEAGSVAMFDICTNESTTMEATICSGESYEFGTQNLTEEGDYMEIYSIEGGCEFIVTLTLNVQEINTEILVEGNVLTVVQEDASIQWIDCENNSIIPGANSSSFTALAPGNYAAKITMSTCFEISDCINITAVGIFDYEYVKGLTAFPNPFSNEISIGSISESINVELVDITGKVVAQFIATPESNKMKIDGLNPGIYILKMESEDGTKILKMIKK